MERKYTNQTTYTGIRIPDAIINHKTIMRVCGGNL